MARSTFRKLCRGGRSLLGLLGGLRGVSVALALLLPSALPLTSGCNSGGSSSSSSSMSAGGGTPMATLVPGETFVPGLTETLSMDGKYLLPEGATSIRTRCTGFVTVDIPTDPPQKNTCSSPDASQSMSNPVAGVSDVTYTFEPGAFAQVTVTVAAAQ